MPKFAANLTMMFTEWDFLDRFQAASDAGFAAVEYLFPYDFSADAIAECLRQNNLTQALFNLPPGDWEAGDRGLAALPERADDFRQSVTRALDYAGTIGVERLHMMAGVADSASAEALACYKVSARYAVEKCADKGLNLLLEPINNRSVPGYFLNDFNMAAQVISDLKMPNLKLQFDIFHRQIIHGDVVIGLQESLPITDHIQIASIPSRHEPDGEELNYPFVFAELDRLEFQGYVGCEYNPRGKTLDGLQWFESFRR
ncbi:MAG: hydroxypyruvate isomerase family protein [Rhodobacteraceae bacterium]|nr:hydroxypyruvate isomerase family protein [Paracoccaceae bacterium]